jgi:hypothetical protein
MLKMKVLIPIALVATSVLASQSSGETYVSPPGTTWPSGATADGEHGVGTKLYDENLQWVGVHVDCSGHGQCYSVSPDRRTLTVNGIITLPNNGYDPGDPIQAHADIYFGSF